jgi:hypothetical protein
MIPVDVVLLRQYMKSISPLTKTGIRAYGYYHLRNSGILMFFIYLVVCNNLYRQDARLLARIAFYNIATRYIRQG